MRFKKSNCRKKMVFSQPDVLPLGDVAKKHTELLRLLQVRKAQNQL